MLLGCHMSCAKGLEAMGREAVRIGANTFQFFLRNPRGSKAKKLNYEDLEGLLTIIRENDFRHIMGHAPYTLNPCSAQENVRRFAAKVMREDIERMEYFTEGYYNFHPGCHVGQGVEAGIELIAHQINELLVPEQRTTVLLETMTGKGTEIGGNFQELAAIMKKVDLKEKIGVTMDICHVFDGGYDIAGGLEQVLERFEDTIGLSRLKAIHLNDSKNELGSRKDRHERIGQGYIGMKAVEKMIHHPYLSHLPFYLETPVDLEGHKKEIELLKEMAGSKKRKTA